MLELVWDSVVVTSTVTVMVVVYMFLLVVVSIFAEKYIRVESLYYTFKTLMWTALTVAFAIPVAHILFDFIMNH